MDLNKFHKQRTFHWDIYAYMYVYGYACAVLRTNGRNESELIAVLMLVFCSYIACHKCWNICYAKDAHTHSLTLNPMRTYSAEHKKHI